VLGCVCPSEILAEELEARGWTAQDLATQVYAPGTNEWSLMVLAVEMYLAVGTTTVNVRLGSLADELGKALGTSVELWRNLETAWLANAVEVDDADVTKVELLDDEGKR
jgi:plasmid maintenance system antidote protein VapI